MSYELRYDSGEGERRIRVPPEGLRIGRGGENDVVLSHSSVSRQHLILAWRGDALVAEDLGSTNGLKVNSEPTQLAVVRGDDVLQVGKFELRVHRLSSRTPRPREPRERSPRRRPATSHRPTVPLQEEARSVRLGTGAADPSAELSAEGVPAGTLIRRLSDFPGLQSKAAAEPGPAAAGKRSDAGAQNYFEALNHLARELLRADREERVLRTVVETVFRSLAVDRAFVLLGSTPETLRCELLRDGDQVEVRPHDAVPVSQTILRTVMEDQVGLLTLDALDDQRLLSGESIRLHGIRSAMCAPLWAEGKIVGFIQVDSPFEKGRFGGEDLDFLITVANYGAVGIQRIQERRSRGLLERYHSPSVVNEVLRADREEIGDRRLRRAEVTVLFGDLVGFTGLSERAPLDDVADLLEGYFDRATAAVFAHGGTLDKFIGDCVMAFFGAPLEQENHAELAVRAALELARSVSGWNAERTRAGLFPVHYRIGINSGTVLVGDVGSRDRVDYTVLGNPVNLASRLESSVARPGDIVVGEATHTLLGGKFPSEPLGEQTVRGLRNVVRAYRIPSAAGAEQARKPAP